jgi:N-acetylglucosamine kinase-like BadF-type ATPase
VSQALADGGILSLYPCMARSRAKMRKGTYLGLDGGGTKTAAVLLDENGSELYRGTAGASNIHTVGVAAAEAALGDAIHNALESAKVTPDQLVGVGLGMAGAARPDDVREIRRMLSRIAPIRSVVITHDAETALVGGVGRRYGAVLIAGTGSIAYAVNAGGEAARADGWGYLLGDEGSAHWIGREGLRAIARAHDGRGPATALTDSVLEHVDLADPASLVPLVYREGFGVAQIAGLAPLVRQAAQTGDPVAKNILCRAGHRLSRSLAAVIHKLGMGDAVFEVLLLGGVLGVRDIVWETVVARLADEAPRAEVIEPRRDAAVGAALLAMQREAERGRA